MKIRNYYYDPLEKKIAQAIGVLIPVIPVSAGFLAGVGHGHGINLDSTLEDIVYAIPLIGGAGGAILGGYVVEILSEGMNRSKPKIALGAATGATLAAGAGSLLLAVGYSIGRLASIL